MHHCYYTATSKSRTFWWKYVLHCYTQRKSFILNISNSGVGRCETNKRSTSVLTLDGCADNEERTGENTIAIFASSYSEDHIHSRPSTPPNVLFHRGKNASLASDLRISWHQMAWDCPQQSPSFPGHPPPSKHSSELLIATPVVMIGGEGLANCCLTDESEITSPWLISLHSFGSMFTKKFHYRIFSIPQMGLDLLCVCMCVVRSCVSVCVWTQWVSGWVGTGCGWLCISVLSLCHQVSSYTRQTLQGTRVVFWTIEIYSYLLESFEYCQIIFYW